MTRSVPWMGLVFAGWLSVLQGCATPGRAPVAERTPAPVETSVSKTAPAVSAKQADWRPATYTVQKGDTLYGIALEHGHDYNDLAAWNNIAPPYTIRVGQVLRLSPPEGATTAPLKAPPPSAVQALPAAVPGATPPAPDPLVKSAPKALKQPYSEAAATPQPEPPRPVTTAKAEAPRESPPTARPGADATEEDAVDWGWPATGKIITNFNENGGSRGIAIGGTMGQPVMAAGAGKVVHIGSTLRGYGKLVIIKHNKSFFSVYAHNSHILVKEGQTVVKGQKIAEMGDTDADQVKLHFEIRRLGKPVDPLKYLPNDRMS